MPELPRFPPARHLLAVPTRRLIPHHQHLAVWGPAFSPPGHKVQGNLLLIGPWFVKPRMVAKRLAQSETWRRGPLCSFRFDSCLFCVKNTGCPCDYCEQWRTLLWSSRWRASITAFNSNRKDAYTSVVMGQITRSIQRDSGTIVQDLDKRMFRLR